MKGVSVRYWIVLFMVLACAPAIPSEEGRIEVLFCDKVNCTARLNALAGADSGLQCAFYNPGPVVPAIRGGLVVDGSHPETGAVVERGRGLMHNKFCVSDGVVWTGSWNPAQGMSVPNNVVFVESQVLADAFQAEFDELSDGVFHGGRKGPGRVLLNGHLVEAFFCPEDNCQEQVLRVLEAADESIFFMTFAFTDDAIGSLVNEKQKAGIDVRGVFDPRKNKYSEYEKLKDWSVVAPVHHKVFIIDKRVVVTGSYNPSKNGNTRNDENLVIIHDESVAELFLEEFRQFI